MLEHSKIIRSLRACETVTCHYCDYQGDRDCCSVICKDAADALETAENALVVAAGMVDKLTRRMEATEIERDTYKRSAEFERGWREDLLRKQESDMERLRVMGAGDSLPQSAAPTAPSSEGAGVDYKAIVDGIAPLAHVVDVVYKKGRHDGVREALREAARPAGYRTGEEAAK